MTIRYDIFDVIILECIFSDYPSFRVNFLKSRGNNKVTEGADATYDECRLFRNRISPAFSPFFQANVPLACSELRIINQVQLGMITDLTASPLLRVQKKVIFPRELAGTSDIYVYVSNIKPSPPPPMTVDDSRHQYATSAV